jgi:hypothetical protein
MPIYGVFPTLTLAFFKAYFPFTTEEICSTSLVLKIFSSFTFQPCRPRPHDVPLKSSNVVKLINVFPLT